MTPAAFRKLALTLDGASENAHGGHPDFRAGRKVFATMGYPDKAWAMVKLTPDQQEMLCAAEPAMFQPVKGGWGLRGATNLKLAAADQRTAKSALAMALRNVTEKKKKP
jgi:YjbR